MSEIGKRLIVMLGMHRSGTSTITRGLKVFGVELGNKLMPPVLGDNDKGYFEDIDLNALNVEMLHALGIDWHCLSPIDQSDVDSLRKKGYFIRAVNLLRQKTACVSIFGFKDPRVSKLLPFWQLVFLHCGYDVGYVLAIRNPLSVAQSLKKRIEFKYEKSYLLWLGHVLISLSQTQAQSRVIVDYDQFLDFPKNNLKLIAKQLNLSLNSKSLQEYQTEFLDLSLRHSFYAVSDLLEDATCPPLVSEIYQYLLNLASKNMQGKAVQEALNSKIFLWMNEFNRLKTSLRMVDSLYEEIASYQQAVNSRETTIVSLNESVIENQQKSLEQVTQARQQREDLLLSMAEREMVFSQQLLEMQQIHEQQKGVQTQQYIEREQALLLECTQARQQREDLLLTMAEREKVFSQQLLEMQQMHEQQNGVQTQQYMEREQAYILDYMQARQQREDLLLTMAEREKVFSQQILELQQRHERQYAEREQVHLLEYMQARQQQEDLLLTMAEREKVFSQQISELRERYELQKDKQSFEQIEHAQKLNAKLVDKQDELIRLVNDFKEIEKLRMNAIAEYRSEINLIRSSYSWRLTAPIRSLAKMFNGGTVTNHKNIQIGLDNIPESDSTVSTVDQRSEEQSPPSVRQSINYNRIFEVELKNISTQATTIDELLSHHDERFIYCAYYTLLGRAPDAQGLRYYLTRLRTGIGKIEILAQIRSGAEGRSRQIDIVGLDELVCRSKKLKAPLLGSMYRFLSKIKLIDIDFDEKWYLKQNPDVSKSGMNAYDHYVLYGKKEGRAPRSSIPVNKKTKHIFDAEWYLKQYEDVANSGMDAYEHFILFGKAEGRRPKPDALIIRSIKMVGIIFSVLYSLIWHDKNINALKKIFREYRKRGLEGIKQEILRINNVSDEIKKKNQSYKLYIAALEPTKEDLDTMVKDQSAFSYKPKFSIVVPVFNVEEKWLRKFVESVRLQVYSNWELCIADDCSTAKHIRPTLLEYAAADERIKVVFREKNGHISAATNSAIELATGDYMCLMDNDDEIAKHALYEFAALLQQNNKIDMIYSDEDKMDLDGRRYEPFFKPDWSPEALEGCMYTAHFACYRMSLVRELGGFRIGYEGAQDYDFVLRFTERAKIIAHIPKILYHWRAIPGSTAATMDAKNYVLDAAVRALNDRVNRVSGSGKVKLGRYAGCFDVRYAIQAYPLVTIVIPSAGRKAKIGGESIDLLANVVKSIHEKNTYKNIEVIVVDNNDLKQETINALSAYNCKFVHFSGQFNIAKKMNLGAKIARGEYLLFMNDDIDVINSDWMECMLQLAQRPGVGVVGAKLYFENGKIQHAGIAFWNALPDHIRREFPGTDPGYFFSSCSNRNYLAVTGAVLMTKRSIFEKVAGFDERYAINYNDIDYCLKVFEMGERIVFASGAELYHYESISRERSVAENEINLFQDRWSNLVAFDPYYSSNFDCHPPNFLLRNDWLSNSSIDKPINRVSSNLSFKEAHGSPVNSISKY